MLLLWRWASCVMWIGCRKPPFKTPHYWSSEDTLCVPAVMEHNYWSLVDSAVNEAISCLCLKCMRPYNSAISLIEMEGGGGNRQDKYQKQVAVTEKADMTRKGKGERMKRGE